jgi:hypothetical protein
LIEPDDAWRDQTKSPNVSSHSRMNFQGRRAEDAIPCEAAQAIVHEFQLAIEAFQSIAHP